MHLNSNDIFSQIGLVIDQSEQFNQQIKQRPYKTHLEIQLSQGRHQILQIKNNDDPYKLACNFCKKHQLNHLATEVIQQKIKESKTKYEQNMNRRSINKQRLKTQYTKSTPKITVNTQQSRLSLTNKSNKNKAQQKTSQSKYSPNNKKKLSPQNKKDKNKQNILQIKPKKQQKSNHERTNQLYGRGVMKMKLRQKQHVRAKQQKQQDQLNNLTFCPQINQVSIKIIQFRRQNGPLNRDLQKQNKNQTINMNKSMKIANEMQQCSFKPKINKVQMIVKNKDNYKDQYDHFNALYQNLQYKQSKANNEQKNQQKQLFHPKINPKNHQIVTQTFQERLQKSLIRKKQIQQGKFQVDSGHTFQPKIGRAPKQHSNDYNVSRVWWDDLYSHNIKKNQLSKKTADIKSNQSQLKLNANTNAYYENLVQKRINQVFDTLDGNGDGFISYNLISIEKLTKHQLLFLMPLFQQIDQLEAVLNYSEFRKAMILLLEDSDIQARGNFLSSKKVVCEQPSFQPLINQKSKAIVNSRINGNIYDQLYDKGLRQMQKKQYKVKKQKIKQQQKELLDCSFKPLINSSSKYYIQKVLNKKIALNNKSHQQSISS